MTLDPELVDSHGIPAPKITYKYSENSLKLMQHGLERGEEVMRAAGATGRHERRDRCGPRAGT